MATRKILLFGAHGMLGREIMMTPLPAPMELTGLARAQADVTDPGSVERALAAHRPHLVINATAYSKVDQAEGDPQAARAVNAGGAGNLAVACHQAGVPLMHFSTDYVFDGALRRPYTESDPPAPLNEYGRSKLEGEELVRAQCPRHLIIRTSWLFGAWAHNFIHTMVGLIKSRPVIKVVDDQVGCPTATLGLAAALIKVAGLLPAQGESAWGTYHLCGPLVLSRYQFAQMIWEAARDRMDKELVLEPVGSEVFAAPAARPAYSALDCAKIKECFGLALEDWRPELARIVAGLLSEEKLAHA
ncbi:MAG: dTDP-4-dehydrorhamnose reductase [Desulfarculaceae bacterium]|nr:dTDP-4-dehydrorhamnose reductase [Desulfarculaceae bacterium]